MNNKPQPDSNGDQAQKRLWRFRNLPHPEPIYGACQQNTSSRRRKQIGFRILLLLAFILGAILAGMAWEPLVSWANHPDLEAFTKEALPRLGDALMIAPLLALLVEIAAAGELLDKFVADVSPHVIGYLLPMELRQHIFAYLTSSFVRKAWFVEYRLTGWPEEKGYYQLATMMQFEIENRSDSRKTYPYCYELAESWCPRIAKPEICHVKMTVDEDVFFEAEKADLQKLVKESRGFVSFEKPVAVSRQPHGVYKFTAESSECFPDRFANYFQTRMPVIKTVIRVYYPQSELEVDVHLSFADDTVLSETDLMGGKEWVVNCPMLPGQSFITCWKPVPSANQPQGQVGVVTRDANNSASTNPGEAAESHQGQVASSLPNPPPTLSRSDQAASSISEPGPCPEASNKPA